MNSILFGFNLLVLFLLYILFNDCIFFTVTNVYEYLFNLYLSKPNFMLLFVAFVITLFVFVILSFVIVFITVLSARFLPLFANEYFVIKKLSDLLFKVFTLITGVRFWFFAGFEGLIPIIISFICGFGIYTFNLSFSTVFDRWAIFKEQK